MPEPSFLSGGELAFRAWAPERQRALVFYVHGIQSHSQWFSVTADGLARHGVATFAVDRRGSGRSRGVRGHLATHEMVLDDYATAFDEARRRAAGTPVLALGQSFGGSVLAALLATRRIEPDAVVFCAPALAQQRARLTAQGLKEAREMCGARRVPLDLPNEHYTDVPEYLNYIERDDLVVRHVTHSTRSVMVRLEDCYCAEEARACIKVPAYLAFPRHDPIIDLEAARCCLLRLAPQAELRTFPTDVHYIEFSQCRGDYLEWLVELVVGLAARGKQS